MFKNCYLTKVEVTADNNIAGNYTLDPSNGEITGAGSDKQIILTTKGSGAYADGFKLDNSTSSTTADKIYMFIKPGTHKLKIRYWLKDLVTGTEGTITKVPGSFTYDKNTYYDMTADLDIRAYSGHDYYMWDAQENYWYQHEWDVTNMSDRWQPTTNGATSSHFPTGVSYYNPVVPIAPASYSCANQPNVNEMVWYVMKGGAQWDAEELWTTMGHLYKGGIWLKKEARIAKDNSTNIPAMKAAAPDGNDHRSVQLYGISTTPGTTIPSCTEISDYFYLPATGQYQAMMSVQLYDLGIGGHYWSSSNNDWMGGTAYALNFNNSYINASSYMRQAGLRSQKFE